MERNQSGLPALPLELLRHIVGILVVDDARYHHSGPDGLRELDIRPVAENAQYIRRKTICSLRLASKALCEAVSYALVPVLRISLTEASLARAEKLASLGQISSGVTAIEFILPYSPKRIASKLSTFACFHTERIDWLLLEHSDHTVDIDDDREDPDYEIDYHEMYNLYQHEDDKILDEQIREEQELQKEELQKKLEIEQERAYADLTHQRWSARRATWISSLTKQGQDDSRAVSDLKLLQQGFERFQALHKEQNHLLTTGTFAKRAGWIASKLHNLHSIYIKDVDDTIRQESHTKSYTDIFMSDDRVLDILAEPVSWFPQKYWLWGWDEAYSDSTAATLLWDLPISIYRAGTILKKLSIHCYPERKAFQPGASFIEGTRDELQKSVSSLETFRFNPGARWSCQSQDKLQRSLDFDDWMGACVSSAKLHNLTISLPAFHDEGPHALPLSNILRHLSTDCLRSVRIDRTAIIKEDVGVLCSRLGTGTTSVVMEGIYVHDGHIANMLDQVRRRVGYDDDNQECRIELSKEYYSWSTG